MRIFICDDEPRMLKKISQKVRELTNESEIEEFAEERNLLAALGEKACDVLLLDIDLPDINGMQIAEQIMELSYKPLLIFVTSHDELVYDSLVFHPFGFIRKAYMDAELPKVLNDCVRELAEKERFFVFKSGSEKVRLLLKDILYLESDGNYLKLFTAEKEYRLRDTIAVAEKQLAGKGFIRFHRGFLVNREAVKVLRTDEAELITGVKIPIGRNYGETAKKRWMRYILK